MRYGTALRAIGLVVALGLILTIRLDANLRDLGVPVGLVVFALFALVGELVGFRRPVATTPPTRPSGKVEDNSSASPIHLSGVEGCPNPMTCGFERFLRFSEASGPPSRVERLSPVAPRLVGRVVLVSLFIGRDGREWKDEELARGFEAIRRAARWIEREADRYGVEVRVGLARTYFQVLDDHDNPVEVAFADEGEGVGPMEARASTKAITAMSRAASRLGFADAVDFIGQINSSIDADSIAWLIHLRQSGRSIAIPSVESDLDGVGVAVCYSSESSFPEPLTGSGRVDPTTVAHELLHLFGATDKYGYALSHFPKGSVTSKDVMRLNHAHLSRMSIDRLTAREIGWDRSEARREALKK